MFVSWVCRHPPSCRSDRMSEQLLFNIDNKRKKKEPRRMWAAVKREREKKRRWLHRWMLYSTWQAKIISHYSKFDAPLTRTCRPRGGYILYLYVILYIVFSISLYKVWYFHHTIILGSYLFKTSSSVYRVVGDSIYRLNGKCSKKERFGHGVQIIWRFDKWIDSIPEIRNVPVGGILIPLVSINRGVLNRVWFDFWMRFLLWLRFEWG